MKFDNLALDDMVYYETADQRLVVLEHTVLDNCYDCGQTQLMSDAQQICDCILTRNIIAITAVVRCCRKYINVFRWNTSLYHNIWCK